jgi:hypothetical protein
MLPFSKFVSAINGKSDIIFFNHFIRIHVKSTVTHQSGSCSKVKFLRQITLIRYIKVKNDFPARSRTTAFFLNWLLPSRQTIENRIVSKMSSMVFFLKRFTFLHISLQRIIENNEIRKIIFMRKSYRINNYNKKKGAAGNVKNLYLSINRKKAK